MQLFRAYSPVMAAAVTTLAMTMCPDAHAAEDILDEVIVTGTLRPQALEQVASSVTVLDERTLRDAGQQHFQDVLGLVPNLNWAGGTSRPRYFQIRGIGEREQYEGAPNPSVGFLIDDMDFSGLGMPATLFDLQQVEVLRGPQGTQYGANALAGLIVVRSNEPQPEAGYSLEATGGDYGTRAVGATATGPVQALNSAWRLSVQRYASDGFMHNAWLGRDTNDRDELTARLKWHTQAGESTQLDFTFLHADIDNGYDAFAIDNSRTTLSDQPGKDAQRATGASLRVTSGELGSNTLTTIASYANSDSRNSFDSDWGNSASWAPYTYEYFNSAGRRRETGSLELRLASPDSGADGHIAWLAGAYALRLVERGKDFASGAYADPGLPVDASEDTLDNRYRATNLALFGQLNGVLAPTWNWTAGLRAEQRRGRYRDDGTVGGEPRASDLAARDRMLGGQLSLSKTISDGVTGYGLLSRGYKAGGFNLGAVPEASRRYDPEYLWNLETGLKTRLPDGRGHAELALFYQWRKDQQVRTGSQLDPTDPNTYVFITGNLPKGYSAGLEASIQYVLTPQLQVGGSLGLLRTRSGGGVDAEGNPVASREQAHAPGYSAAVNVTWRNPAGVFARVDVTAMDAFYFDVPTDHDRRSQAYSLTHVKFGYEQARWSLYGWVRNVFDEDYAVRGFFFSNEPPDWEPKLYTQKGDARQWGVTATFSF
ncbi:MAG: TonB-dependent receptor [Steroidobacteraceae bacterium]